MYTHLKNNRMYCSCFERGSMTLRYQWLVLCTNCKLEGLYLVMSLQSSPNSTHTQYTKYCHCNSPKCQLYLLQEPGLYIGNVSVPLEGWRAFMIEVYSPSKCFSLLFIHLFLLFLRQQFKVRRVPHTSSLLRWTSFQTCSHSQTAMGMAVWAHWCNNALNTHCSVLRKQKLLTSEVIECLCYTFIFFTNVLSFHV